jgi:hypothetical protein
MGRGATEGEESEAAILLLACRRILYPPARARSQSRPPLPITPRSLSPRPLAWRRILRRVLICKTLALRASRSRATPIIASSSASLEI